MVPFYPSPDQDDDYDVTDFYGVDPRLGSLGQFVEVVRTARDRGCAFVAVHNFGAEPCRLELPLDGIDDAVAADDLLDGSWEHPLEEPVLHLTLDGYGYQWLRIRRAGQRLSP